jgi:hypothetical protein
MDVFPAGKPAFANTLRSSRTFIVIVAVVRRQITEAMTRKMRGFGVSGQSCEAVPLSRIRKGSGISAAWSNVRVLVAPSGSSCRELHCRWKKNKFSPKMSFVLGKVHDDRRAGDRESLRRPQRCRQEACIANGPRQKNKSGRAKKILKDGLPGFHACH